MIKITRMTVEHLGDVAELEQLCFCEPWSVDALQLLLGDMAIGYVVERDGRAVAYAGMMIVPGEGQVTNVAVHPDARRRGYGRMLTEALCREARERELEQISLEVRESNASAIALYQSIGFYEAGRRRRFYRNPTEDAVVMLWNADEPKENNK